MNRTAIHHYMHHVTFGIGSLLYSDDLILFTLLMVQLILCVSVT